MDHQPKNSFSISYVSRKVIYPAEGAIADPRHDLIWMAVKEYKLQQIRWWHHMELHCGG
jgi:hypothetical protein